MYKRQALWHYHNLFILSWLSLIHISTNPIAGKSGGGAARPALTGFHSETHLLGSSILSAVDTSSAFESVDHLSHFTLGRGPITGCYHPDPDGPKVFNEVDTRFAHVSVLFAR